MREYSNEMREISGFGGDYEKACREMVLVGLNWFDDNPTADPQFSGCKYIYGVCIEDNDDAKSLSEAIVSAASDCTGAMHQACVSHVLYAHKVGWDRYVKEMSK